MGKIYKATPVALAKEVVLALFHLMQHAEGPQEFAHRAQQAIDAALLAKLHGKSEEELLAVIDAFEAEEAGLPRSNQPPARA